MSLIAAGKRLEIEGLPTRSWMEDATLRLSAGDRRARHARVTGIVPHTTKGIPGGKDLRPQVILPGIGPSTNAGRRCARLWATDERAAGAHLVIDHDGAIACLADLQTEAAYHAGTCNERTIGIELYQGAQAELYEGQLDVCVRLIDWLTRFFGIQRQLHWPYMGPIERLEVGRPPFVGIWGHRDCSGNRGPGDPGDAIGERLRAAGYDAWNTATGEDVTVWRARQARLGIDPDGIPGPTTCDALKRAGRPHGLWVPRPGD